MAGHGNESEQSRSVTIDELYDELLTQAADDRPVAVATEAATGPDARTRRLVRGVLDELFRDASFAFEEAIVKDNLDELLLLLVGVRGSKTHGKALMGDLAHLFDAQLSPGTVYPRLHELAESGVLDPREMVRTKEYRVSERADAVRRLERSMRQHLALAAVFHAALEEL